MAPRQRMVIQQPSQEDLTMAGPVSPNEEEEEEIKPLVQNTNNVAAVATDEAVISLARERHDIFNVVALLVVIAATLINWDFRLLAQGPSRAFTGHYFYLNWATTEFYFLIDLIWVALVPTCVKSPDVIIKHHLVAMAYLSGPMIWPEFRWFMGACLSVELNTWFLIVRRVVYKRKDRIHPAVIQFVSLSFYTSWVAIRIFLYPTVMYIFVNMYLDAVATTGVFFHWPMIFMPVHFFLCLLNLKWSYDLFEPLISPWMMTSATEKETINGGVSSGL